MNAEQLPFRTPVVTLRISLRRRAPDGAWSTIATTEFDLACCVAVDDVIDVIDVGTDDARVLRVDADVALEQLRGLDVAGVRSAALPRRGRRRF